MRARAQERSEGYKEMGVEASRINPITKREITEKQKTTSWPQAWGSPLRGQKVKKGCKRYWREASREVHPSSPFRRANCQQGRKASSTLGFIFIILLSLKYLWTTVLIPQPHMASGLCHLGSRNGHHPAVNQQRVAGSGVHVQQPSQFTEQDRYRGFNLKHARNSLHHTLLDIVPTNS